MTFAAASSYPEDWVNLLPNEVEMCELVPRFDFPEGTCITAKFKVLSRPLGYDMPADTYIVDRQDGAVVPYFMQKQSWPQELSMGDYSRNVEMYSMRATARLPTGAHLGNSIEVVEDPDVELVLPRDVYLVKVLDGANRTSHLFEFLTGADIGLSPSTFLHPGIEILRLLPTFVLPVGVLMNPSAILHPSIQFPPGVHMGKGLKVVRRPPDMYLPEAHELFRSEAGFTLPVGMELSQASLDAPLPIGYIVLRFLAAPVLPTAMEVASLLEVEDMLPRGGLEGFLTAEGQLLPGLVLLRRAPASCAAAPSFLLPAGLQLLRRLESLELVKLPSHPRMPAVNRSIQSQT